MAKVVIIDSKQDNLDFMSTSLMKLIPGCAVLTAQSEDEGIEKAHTELPDIIIIDIKMAMDGARFWKRLKADDKAKQILVILLTNPETGAKDRAKGLDAGAVSFLAKPVDESELVAQINAALRIKEENEFLRNKRQLLKKVAQERTEALHVRTHDLGQRIKQLNCLYSMAALREKPGTTLEEILQGVTDLVPPSFQFPENTCARIVMGYQEFRTDNFKTSAWKQDCDIMVNGEWGGTLEVYCLEKPEDGEKPFLEEEINLLKAIAERLGRIAERVKAEDALRIESENVISIMRSMEDWIYIVNEEYDIKYINPAIEKEFGPVEGRKCYDYFRDLKEPCQGCRNQDVFSGKTVRWEWELSKNQKTYDVLSTPTRNYDGSISRLSILRDLTALKMAQKNLEERELIYRSLTESVADAVVLVQDGKILFVNNAFIKMFGYSEYEEIFELPITELFDSEFRELFRKVFDPKETDEDIGALLWGMCATKGGRKFWVSTNRSIISLKSRPAILATMRNITEQVLWEKSMQEDAEYLRKENVKLRSCIKERYRFGGIIGKSLAMQNVYELILKAAGSDANVIVLGESGTGKELVARAVHEMSDSADNPFVPVNCGAIPDNLVESEFFGHVKGAFTGAHINKTGYLQTADGGTLFLDEVGELGLNIQVKLLRALESGEYMPVGDTHVRESKFRVVSATNRDFSEMVGKGHVREDFYYRISVIPIVLPALREKKEDIPLLIEHFLRLYCKGKKLPVIPGRILEVLYNYNWPGNVRELQSVIQRYLAVGNFDFLAIDGKSEKTELVIDEDPGVGARDLRSAVEIFEKRFILNVLNQNRWQRGKVADALGIDPKTLYMKMKKAGLS